MKYYRMLVTLGEGSSQVVNTFELLKLVEIQGFLCNQSCMLNYNTTYGWSRKFATFCT